MCESDVYMLRNGQEELLMEKVDRVIPGEDDTIFLENIFGERRVVKARLREMELVRHRILLEDLPAAAVVRDEELWLEPDSDHGHFHEGEEVVLRLYKGYNMQSNAGANLEDVQVVLISGSAKKGLQLHRNNGQYEIRSGQGVDGLLQIYVHQPGIKQLYGKILVEVGHHHHHDIEALNLPLEIVPCGYSHARIGDYYEMQVLHQGQPLAGAEIKATFTGVRGQEYPRRLKSDENGKAKIFLSARGHYLFSTEHDNTISTFTLVKSL